MTNDSRRSFLASLAALALSPRAFASLPDNGRGLHGFAARAPRVRVRAITAGVTLTPTAGTKPVEAALAMLSRAKETFTAEGHVVQTIRIATQPFVNVTDAASRKAVLDRLVALDAAAAANNASFSVGPILTRDQWDADLAPWAADVIAATRQTSISIVVASPTGGVHARACATAAATMLAIANATPGGQGNFRFAAAANVPPGTPFFPVAYHGGPGDAIAVGLESASLVQEAIAGVAGDAEAARRLREAFTTELAPVERIARSIAQRERRAYLGIDPSPAPLLDNSIGGAVEAFTRVPFGDSSTLNACALITAAIRSIRVKTCGYAGLMLPVLEDSVLARRADELRYGLQELLLYSSVCGTGLDVVPVPGDTSRETLQRVIGDVAALAVRLRKPLSARLFPVPGKKAGEVATFQDQYLVRSCRVFPVA